MGTNRFCSTQYSVGYAIFSIIFAEYFKRFSISLVIVAMTTDLPEINGTINITDDVYAWDRNTRGYITSSFFYSYSVSTFLWGFAISRFGVRTAIIACHVVGCITQLTFPWAADVGPALLCVLRGIDGLFSGLIYVTACELLGNWTTQKERVIFSTIGSAAGWIGILCSFLVPGLIVDTFGWRYVCYVTSGVLLFSLLFWLRFGYDNPSVHPRISKTETERINSFVNGDSLVKRRAPWRKIISSKKVAAIAVFHTSFNWNYYGVISIFPQYLKDVHNFKLVNIGLLNSLPFILALVSSLLFGHLSNRIQKKLFVTNTKYRVFPSAVCFLLIALGGKNLVICICSMALNGFLLGISDMALYANFAEISPRYSGEVSSISNGFANIPGYLGPLFTGLITQQNATQNEWMFVFLIFAAVSACGGIVYSLLGSGEIQSWNKHERITSASLEQSTNLVKPQL